MAKTLSVDLRERVVAAVEGGMSRRQAADRFATRYERRTIHFKWLRIPRRIHDLDELNVDLS
ncbi:hypothetical protein V5F53_21420 [Xanthobacter sp. V4C-4]